MKLKVTAFWLVVMAALFVFLQEYDANTGRQSASFPRVSY